MKSRGLLHSSRRCRPSSRIGRSLKKFKTKKMPTPAPLKEFLVREADVPADKTEEVISYIKADAETAAPSARSAEANGSTLRACRLRRTRTRLSMSHPKTMATRWRNRPSPGPSDPYPGRGPGVPGATEEGLHRSRQEPDTTGSTEEGARPVQGRVRRRGRRAESRADPISKKVADLMQEECSSGIFIFTADERFLREENERRNRKRSGGQARTSSTSLERHRSCMKTAS